MKRMALQSQRQFEKRGELLKLAAERTQAAREAFRRAPKGEREKRYAALKATVAAELRASA
jgi:hypothetical protein